MRFGLLGQCRSGCFALSEHTVFRLRITFTPFLIFRIANGLCFFFLLVDHTRLADCGLHSAQKRFVTAFS